MQVDIFIPCFIDQVKPKIAFDMVKVLEQLGCRVHYNEEQTCCGQPAYNAGFWEASREVSEKFIREAPDRYIVSPSASCVGMVRNSYSNMFRNSSIHNKCRQLQKNLYEFSEFIVDVLQKEQEIKSTFEGKVTYHDSCSALRECKIKEAPRKLLQSVAGIELVEMDDVETCCGFGGTFAVKFEPVSSAMAEQKVNYALGSGAEYLVSTDYSCLMHLEGYIKKKKLPLKALHLAEVLATGL